MGLVIWSMLAAQVLAAPPMPPPPPPQSLAPAPSGSGTVVVETLLESFPDRPPPPPTVWIVPEPKVAVRVTNMEAVFNEGNYPFWANKYGIEGALRFRVAVDASGRALGCEIVNSSGAPALDHPTCDLLMSQARFAPALDRRGRPIAGIYSRQIRWQLANREPHAVANSSERAIITVDADGHRQCRMEVSPGADPDPRTCQAYLTTPALVMTVARLLDERAGQRDRWELVVHEGSLVAGGPAGGPAGEGAGIGEGKGEELIWRSRHRLTIDPAGKVSGCTPIERGAATEAEWAQTCAVSRLSEFEAGAGERSVVVVGAMFVRER